MNSFHTLFHSTFVRNSGKVLILWEGTSMEKEQWMKHSLFNALRQRITKQEHIQRQHCFRFSSLAAVRPSSTLKFPITFGRMQDCLQTQVLNFPSSSLAQRTQVSPSQRPRQESSRFALFVSDMSTDSTPGPIATPMSQSFDLSGESTIENRVLAEIKQTRLRIERQYLQGECERRRNAWGRWCRMRRDQQKLEEQKAYGKAKGRLQYERFKKALIDSSYHNYFVRGLEEDSCHWRELAKLEVEREWDIHRTWVDSLAAEERDILRGPFIEYCDWFKGRLDNAKSRENDDGNGTETDDDEDLLHRTTGLKEDIGEAKSIVVTGSSPGVRSGDADHGGAEMAEGMEGTSPKIDFDHSPGISSQNLHHDSTTMTETPSSNLDSPASNAGGLGQRQSSWYLSSCIIS